MQLKALMTPISPSSTRLTFALLLLIAGGSSAGAQQHLQIIFAEAPAFLIQIDGEPVYRNIPGTELARIVNTTALIVRDGAGIHFMKVLDGWMESYELIGNWSVSGMSPFGEDTTIERSTLASTGDRLVGTGHLDDNPPSILIATKPAALVLTDGAARYETVLGTSLRYLANSDTKVFLEPTDGEIYVQVNSDWYRARTADGPWDFVPSNQRPADIVKQLGR